MNEDEDIPLLQDLVRPGVDGAPVEETPAPEPEPSATDITSTLKDLVLDEEIRRILQQHMDAAYAEIMQLIQQQKNNSDDDRAD
ncbi:MAG: hypothetical protein QNJ69_14990 [Gammaproteobacteria bacterium]|nr:hypothetical protein [Gammaproteobacteria bacterium]